MELAFPVPKQESVLPLPKGRSSCREPRRLVEGRPEGVVRYVRKIALGVSRNGNVRVDGLGTVVIAEQILAGSVEDRVFLQVVSPIRDGNGVAGLLGCFDGVLIDG